MLRYINNFGKIPQIDLDFQSPIQHLNMGGAR